MSDTESTQQDAKRRKVGKEQKTDKSEWRVRVARYTPGSPPPPPRSPDGFINVLIHVRDPLSPYVVKNAQGHLLENIWQSAKLYEKVTAQRIAKHKMRPNDIVWEHPAETHVASRDPLTVTPQYWQWREKLLRAPYAVRYPNGFNGRHSVVGALWLAKEGEQGVLTGPDAKQYVLLNYIAARKRIYCSLYADLTPNDPEMLRLTRLLERGEKLQLWEVDGPGFWPEEPFNTLSVAQPGLDLHDINVVREWLNNTKRPFGHGVVLGALLLHGTAWITE